MVSQPEPLNPYSHMRQPVVMVVDVSKNTWVPQFSISVWPNGSSSEQWEVLLTEFHFRNFFSQTWQVSIVRADAVVVSKPEYHLQFAMVKDRGVTQSWGVTAVFSARGRCVPDPQLKHASHLFSTVSEHAMHHWVFLHSAV